MAVVLEGHVLPAGTQLLPSPYHHITNTNSNYTLIQIAMVLQFVLIQNRQGKTRLAKWYSPYSVRGPLYPPSLVLC